MGIRKRIQERLDALNITARAASLAAGLNSHFVQNILSGKTHSPKVESLEKLAHVLQATPQWLIKGESVAESNPFGPLQIIQTKPILVRGSVQAGRWTEAADEVFQIANVEDAEVVQIAPPPGFARANLFGLRVEGNSMDLVYPEGTVVIVCPINETEVHDGENVIVMRRKSGFAETTVKQALLTPDGWVLQARSSDPAFADPIPMIEDGDDGPEIIGVVIGSYRYERRPTATYRP